MQNEITWTIFSCLNFANYRWKKLTSDINRVQINLARSIEKPTYFKATTSLLSPANFGDLKKLPLAWGQGKIAKGFEFSINS